LELAPKNSGALLNLALLKAFGGHFDEAVPLTEREIALDPLGTGTHLNFAAYLAAVGRYDEAEATLRRAISVQPSSSQTYLNLARLQIQRGQYDAALESAKKETDPFFRTYALALAYFASGDHAQADAQLKKLIDEDADDGSSQIASVYALRKEPDKVFEWLEHAWLTHDPGVSEIMLDPFLRTFKDDPRFMAFAQKIGVMPKAGGKP
jgi:serine/threonine-protein kinase